MNLFAELQRRNVIRMAGLYLVGAWLLVQVAGTLLPVFEAPAWVMKTLVGALALLFVPALVFSWVFELTPDGLRRDSQADSSGSGAPQTAQRMNRMLVAALVLALCYFAVDKLVLAPRSQAAVAANPPAETSPSRPARPTATGIERSIAVLPFVNMSADKDQEYFSDGISEEILNALTQINGLKVVGRTSSFKFKGHNEDLRVIGEQLGVAHLLEGSIRKQGDNVRITAQLIKVEDGFHLWSKTYDRKLTDIFAVQDEISVAIAGALSAKLMHAGPNRPGAGVEPAAYDLYLRARQLLAQRRSESVSQAAALFESAAIIAPDFDAAHAGQARALSILWNFTGETPTASVTTAARRAVERALAINPRNAEAHSTLGYLQAVHSWNWEDALRATRLAVTLAPNDAEVANFAGDVYRFVGDLERGLEQERRAIELDPLLPINRSDLSWVLVSNGDCGAAASSAQEALALDAKLGSAMVVMAAAQICLGQFEPATATLDRVAAQEGDSSFLLDMRTRQALAAGQRQQAQAYLSKMLRRTQSTTEDFYYAIAQHQAALGEPLAAARSLELAYAGRDPYFPSDDLYLLPEDWPPHPAILAALDKPELKALYALRRQFLTAQKRRQFK